MSLAARLMLFGMLFAVAGVMAYALAEWPHVLGAYPHYVRPLKRMTAVLLRAAWYWAYAVPALMLLAALFRLVTVKAGRGAIVWRAFAYFTLWVIGSIAFFLGIFVAYLPGMGEGGRDLLVPAMFGCVGYMVMGMGFLGAVLRRS